MDVVTRKRFERVRLWRALGLLWLTYCCYSMVRRPFSVARAEIEKELGVTAALLSWVDTSFVITYSLTQFLYGTLKARFGYTRILLVGFTCSILSCIVMTYSNSVLVFVLVWGINGLAQGTGWASCMELISAWVFPNERGSVMGVWSTNMPVGGVLGNVVPAYLMGRGFSWRSATLLEVLCGPCVVLAVTTLGLLGNPNQAGYPSVKQTEKGITVEQLRDTPKLGFTVDGEYILAGPLAGTATTAAVPPQVKEYGRPQEQQDSDVVVPATTTPAYASQEHEKDRAEGMQESSVSVLRILRFPGALGYSLSYFLHKLVRYSFMFWLPYYLNKELQATSEVAGYIASAFDVGGVLGIVLSGYASDCLYGGRRRILVLLLFTAGMAASTLFLGLFSSAFAGAVWLCTALVFLVGLFSFAIDALQSGPCLLGFCDALRAPVGAMSGVVGGVGSLGSALQGMFTVLLSSSSWSVLFVSFSAATVVAGLLMARPFVIERSSALVKK